MRSSVGAEQLDLQRLFLCEVRCMQLQSLSHVADTEANP
jgi:hypothetical protein